MRGNKHVCQLTPILCLWQVVLQKTLISVRRDCHDIQHSDPDDYDQIVIMSKIKRDGIITVEMLHCRSDLFSSLTFLISTQGIIRGGSKKRPF